MVSDWILYDDFVDLVRHHHHDAYSGLITGVSNNNHSFQIGFDRGEIVLLTYRIRKGMAALQLLTQIERAKITEHPPSEVPETAGKVPETSAVLSRLTANTLDETTTTTDLSDISDIPSPRKSSTTSRARTLDANLKQRIERAAVHHFGPIGAMVCEEHLSNPKGEVREIMLAIALDVGANEADTRAFFYSVSGN